MYTGGALAGRRRTAGPRWSVRNMAYEAVVLCGVINA